MPGDAAAPPADDGGPVRAASRALVTLLFLLVPLASLPTLGDPYTLPKWHVLDAFGLLLLGVELILPWREAPLHWPRLAAAAGLTLVSVGRLAPHGWAWISPILLDRAVSLLLPLLLWRAARRGDLVSPMRRGLFVSLPAVTGIILFQALGRDPLWLFGGGDHRSATFGNVNLAAEFLGFATLALLTLGVRRPAPERSTEIVSSLAFGALLVLGSRSVLLGVLTGTVVLGIRRAIPRPTLARIGVGGAAVACTLLMISPYTGSAGDARALEVFPSSGHPLTESGRAHKQASMELRLAAWRGTLMLLADEPFGQGALGFEHSFIPYQLATSPSPNEALWFRSPHNELLRLGVEHGLPVALLLVLLLAPLPLCAWRGRVLGGEGPWLVGGGALLGAQCLFQFPLETGCGAIFAALWLALLLGATGPAVVLAGRLALPKRLGLAAALVAAAFGAWALQRSVRANTILGDGKGERRATRTACELEPRDLGTCVTAAWLESAHGRPDEALRLTESILRHSPHYYPAIKLLGELRLGRGGREAGCQDLALYERLFAGRGLASPIIDTYCPPDTRARSRTVVDSLFWPRYPGLFWKHERRPENERAGNQQQDSHEQLGPEALRAQRLDQGDSQVETAMDARRNDTGFPAPADRTRSPIARIRAPRGHERHRVDPLREDPGGCFDLEVRPPGTEPQLPDGKAVPSNGEEAQG